MENETLAGKLKRVFKIRGTGSVSRTPSRSGGKQSVERRYHGPDASRPPKSNRAPDEGSQSGRATTIRRTADGVCLATEIRPVKEFKVQKKHLSPLVPALVLLLTLMVMGTVYMVSTAYQRTARVSALKDQLTELEETTERLTLAIEEKNDIRTIGDIATSELGMIKEDTLQRRFVSLSEGERIELAVSEETGETGGGVLLSAFSDYLEQIADRFR